jgi:hypothetical protein
VGKGAEPDFISRRSNGAAPCPRVELKRIMPSGQLWDIYASLISTDGIIQRMIVMRPGAPPAAVEALRAAIIRVNADPAYGEEATKSRRTGRA